MELALQLAGGVTIGFARMNWILEIDIENEAGGAATRRRQSRYPRWPVQSLRCPYAPDPSSQRACTIGGNVAENSGGPHTLACGVTTNHVLGLDYVYARRHWFTPTGSKEPDLPEI